jgi:hypothetical protein
MSDQIDRFNRAGAIGSAIGGAAIGAVGHKAIEAGGKVGSATAEYYARAVAEGGRAGGERLLAKWFIATACSMGVLMFCVSFATDLNHYIWIPVRRTVEVICGIVMLTGLFVTPLLWMAHITHWAGTDKHNRSYAQWKATAKRRFKVFLFSGPMMWAVLTNFRPIMHVVNFVVDMIGKTFFGNGLIGIVVGQIAALAFCGSFVYGLMGFNALRSMRKLRHQKNAHPVVSGGGVSST